MNHIPETKRLREATAALAATITEIIHEQIRMELEKRSGLETHISREASEGWVGQKEVAAHLSLSRRTIHSWTNDGTLPHIRLGRRLLFKISEVDEALKRKTGRNQLRW